MCLGYMVRKDAWTFERAEAFMKGMVEWMQADKNNIFWLGYIVEQGLYKDVVRHLIGKFPELTTYKKQADDLQELRLIQKSGHDTVKSIFLLKNLHGYEDKKTVESTNININKTDKATLAKLGKDDLLEQIRKLAETKATN